MWPNDPRAEFLDGVTVQEEKRKFTVVRSRRVHRMATNGAKRYNAPAVIVCYLRRFFFETFSLTVAVVFA